MNNIKIVRLKNGEDIVGFVTNQEDGNIDISEPMSVGIEFKHNQSGLVMKHWLPVQLVKENHTVIQNGDILCVFEPANDFAEYYVNTINKINELLEAKQLVESMTDEEIEDAINEMENLYQSGEYTLH